MGGSEVLSPPNFEFHKGAQVVVVHERVYDAVDYSTPPRAFQPRESKPAPSDEQHGAVVVAVKELEFFALAYQDERVNKLHVLGQVENVDKKPERARPQLAGGQAFGRTKQAGDAAELRVLRALKGAKKGADENDDSKRNHRSIVKHDKPRRETNMDALPKANH